MNWVVNCWRSTGSPAAGTPLKSPEKSISDSQKNAKNGRAAGASGEQALERMQHTHADEVEEVEEEADEPARNWNEYVVDALLTGPKQGLLQALLLRLYLSLYYSGFTILGFITYACITSALLMLY